mgnify:CR=1 FL=1
MALLSISSAPKDRPVLLFFPELGCCAASWWVGSWSWVKDQWMIHTPLTHDNKMITITGLPMPIGWANFPES